MQYVLVSRHFFMDLYQKSKYTTLLLFLFGICYCVYNYINVEYFSYFEIKILLILFLCIVVFFFLPRRLKSEITVLPILAILICIVIIFQNSSISIDTYRLRQENQILSEYSTRDCTLAQKKFTKDLDNKSLKYFSFGMGYPINLSKKLKKYNVEYFHQGCTSDGGYYCYNILVENYLYQKFNIKIADLSK